MSTWDIYQAGELVAARVGTDEMMRLLQGLVTKEARTARSITIRPGGSPVIGRVERVEDTFRCPSCTLAVQVGDVFVTGNDGRRVCSVFCQRRLTKGR